MKTVSLSGIKKTYKSGKVTFQALNGFDLEAEKGEFVLLSGPSGCGKTTALNIIGCLDLADEGKAEVCGVKVGGQTDKELAYIRNRKIGFIFQNFNLIPVLNLIENVAYPLMIGNGKDSKEKAAYYLDRVGMGDLLKRRPNELSGGQRQRASVARAFVAEPDLILADEPTANLDSKNSENIIELIEELQKERKLTVVASSHDNLMKSCADRIVSMVDGKVVTNDTVLPQQNGARENKR